MKIPSDVICGVCKKVFCCAECRYKHEIKTHAIIVEKPKVKNQVDGNLEPTNLGDPLKESETSKIFLFCPLCERKPMPLQRDMYAEMLAHVEQHHLPLRCRNCTKVYNRIDELQNFSKCTHTTVPICCYPEQGCCDQTCDTVTTMQKDLAKVTISTQTSPQRRQNGEFHETPMSIINLRWKAKSKLKHEEFVSDSISSLKNISSINSSSMRRSLDAIVRPKGQLVRTTSTPVHAELLCTKHTERTFNASGGQVSSIYHTGAESDNHSPALPAVAAAVTNTAGASPAKPHLESINRYLKVGGPRSKISAVTPLRQVMSKSIQKAFAEHGVLPLTRAGDAEGPPLHKKIFDSQATDSSSIGVSSPLDLRLSPAVRRTHSEECMSQFHSSTASAARKSSLHQNLHHEVLRSSQKLTTTESIVIRRTKHMTSVASASGISDGLSSNASKTSDKSTASSSSATSNSSGISSSSGNSVYKTCESIEIITATTAFSEIQQDYYAVSDQLDSAMEKIVPTMESVAQVVSTNLAPITPITRIPGALINKKLIRFDSPCEEDEDAENSKEIENHLDKENRVVVLQAANTPQLSTLPHTSPKHNHRTAVAGSKAMAKFLETPHSTNSSVSDVFFTPNATPIRTSKTCAPTENVQKPDDFNKGATLRPPSFGKSGRSAAFDHTENINNNVIENVETLPEITPKHMMTQKSTSPLARSWSFGALLGSVMRLNSKGKAAATEKIETPPTEGIHSDSLIKRCASIA
ncbi:PREDICTED: mitosis initiation protein fs(1)Ya, partial [Rhagoletis zephyria]|uniref:mitosis initiation protein fs(1)Ya n=1 Tax=Rhagoletis zephyria TaxID=28612 RepID=UPI00081156D0